jgi:hypothetical protein
VEKLSERIRQKYCIFDEVVEPVYPSELKEIILEVEALELNKVNLHKELWTLRAQVETQVLTIQQLKDEQYEAYKENRKNSIAYQLMITELHETLRNTEAERGRLQDRLVDEVAVVDDLKRERDALKESRGKVEAELVLRPEEVQYQESLGRAERAEEQLGIAQKSILSFNKKLFDAEAEVKTLREQKYFEIKASPELEKRLSELALDNLEKGARLVEAEADAAELRQIKEYMGDFAYPIFKSALEKCIVEGEHND